VQEDAAGNNGGYNQYEKRGAQADLEQGLARTPVLSVD
jgi:hypothetical protein